MQKITPFLWFDSQAEEAVNFYTSIFNNSKVDTITRYNEASAAASGRPAGSVMTAAFELEGYSFTAINGGPEFKFNPSISFFLNFDPSKDKNSRMKLDSIWEKLSEGGTPLMPLDKYPFSEHYGWIQDKYGISWQLILSNPDGEERPFIVPSLMFTGAVCGKAEEASDFYLSIFKNSKRGTIARYPAGMEKDKEGTMMYTDFRIGDQWFAAMDSGWEHGFGFNEAISFVISCENQEEIDHFWNKLSADPQSERCGWLKDKYGISWQVVPAILPKLLKDGPKSQKVMQAILNMKKLSIAELEKAYEGH